MFEHLTHLYVISVCTSGYPATAVSVYARDAVSQEYSIDSSLEMR